MKRWIALLLACLLSFGLAGCGEEAFRYEGGGYKTPEAAMEAYVEAMKTGDVDAMIKVFAVETYVENFDFDAYLNRTRSWSVNAPIPGSNSFADPINLAKRLEDVCFDIQLQLFTLMGWEEVCVQPTIIGENGTLASSEEFLNTYNTDRIVDKVKGIRLISVEAETELSGLSEGGVATHKENLAKQAAAYGADEVDGYVATLECEGQEYYLGLMLARYGNRWFVFVSGGPLLGIPAHQGGLALADDLDIS